MQKGVAQRGDPEIARRTVGQEELPELAFHFRSARHLSQMIEDGALVEQKAEPRRREAVKRDHLQVDLGRQRHARSMNQGHRHQQEQDDAGNVEDRLSSLAHVGKLSRRVAVFDGLARRNPVIIT